MARLLVMARDKHHPDPEKDRRLAWKLGDIVAIMPDGHVWGRAERLPDFLRVDMPGADAASLRDRMEPDETVEIVAGRREVKTHARRKWHIPPGQLVAALKSGKGTLAASAIKRKPRAGRNRRNA